jgi:predicted dehydrogenase
MQTLAILGLGGWGRRLVDSVQTLSPHVRFSHAIVQRPDAHADYAAKQGLRLTSDLSAVLADASVDGIVSCGPAHLHAAHSLAALEARKPVLAIKPMALTRADAQRLGEAAARTGTLLALGYNRCFFPNVVEMRRRLAAGDLGTLVHTEGNFCVDRYRGIKANSWKADPTFAPPGGLADHMLYLTIETLGPIAEVAAFAQYHHSDNGLADATAMLLRTEGKHTALLTAIGTTADYYRFTVFGTEGWIELRDDTQLIYQPRTGQRQTKMFEAIDAERAEIEAFARALTGDETFAVPPADAVHGVAVLEALAEAARSGRPVHL